MAARVSTPSQSFGPSSHEAGSGRSPCARVVSVSPRVAEAERPDAADSTTSFHFPRVEAISTEDRTSDALISLIAMSRQTELGLRELIEKGRTADRKTTRAALHLQERLRLGARMLQAFQLQIGRVEKSLAKMREHELAIQSAEERINRQLANLQAQAELVISDIRRRCEEASRCDGAEASSSAENH